MAKGDPQPTDLAEKLIAVKRRTATQTRPKEKSERPVSEKPEKSPRPVAGPSQPLRMSPKRQHAAPQVIIQRPSADADAEDFSRRLNISTHSSPRAAQSSSKSNQHSKLYNPDRDPIPTMRRTTEPEAMSDTPSNGRLVRDPDAPTRQLFDHRKDNPVRFSVLGRQNHHNQRQVPTPKSSGEYISASSTSSYAASQVSSTFTLSSTTDGSSASSALFDRGDRPHEESSGTNVFALQLKKLYRAITSMEMKIQKEEPDEEKDGRDNSRILLKGRNTQAEENETERDKDKWIRRIEEHKTLAETIHNLLGISLAPSVPASLRNIPTKYNIMVRLWTFGFHRLLEDLRRASLTSSLALEHLQSFIYYAYTFYTSLLEEPPLSQFKSSWLEALGDLARYRMMVATMINGSAGPSYAAVKVSSEATPRAETLTNGHLQIPHDSGTKSVSNAAAARIDDSPSPSVGVAAARSMELKPEVEQWRHLARDWYGKGLTEQPGTGRLHGHLGMLSREVRGEELRAVYHFVKSMTTLHPFSVSRESILSIWSPEAQARRQLPEAPLPDLFVFLHGMLFTNIQLDDFRPTLFRFIERLELEGAEERTWTMMAVVNIGAILEYNKSNSTLKRCGGVSSRETGSTNPVRLMAKKESTKDDDKMDVDEKGSVFSPPPSDGEQDAIEQSIGFKFALELTFAMLSYVLRHPTRRASPYSKSRLNPYLTVILTFLATMLKHEKTREVMERSIPWEELAAFFATIPRAIMHSQGLDRVSNTPDGERWMMLTSSCAPPLPEDWCLRGMEWVGRKVFERGYWKSGEDRQAEIEVLDETEVEEMDDGRIETDGDDEDNSQTKKRYIRIVRSAVTLAGEVPGFTWVEGTREWRVEGELSAKVQRWKEEDRQEREVEERRKMGTRWADDDLMDVDEDTSELLESSSDDDDELDSPEIRELKERRRYLQSLLKSSQMEFDRSSVRRSSAKERRSQQALPMQPGYTVLVVDTNILLSALSMFSSLVESFRWTILVPLPVIMELDGLKGNASPQLSEAAENALNYITSHIRSHSLSLKVQTSKGNYLTSLNVRTEAVDFAHGKKERSMDDLILKTAMWHEEHWTDRSAMLKVDDTKKFTDPVKVVLLSLDRNLRLKARSRQLPAAGEKDLGVLLADGK